MVVATVDVTARGVHLALAFCVSLARTIPYVGLTCDTLANRAPLVGSGRDRCQGVSHWPV